MSDFERKLRSIRVLFRAPDTLALYGIPYDMREGQSPGDLWRGRRQPIVYDQTYGRTEAAPGPREDWIWLGTPGWWGTMPKQEQKAVEAFLAEHKDSIPGGPYEWDRIEGDGDLGAGGEGRGSKLYRLREFRQSINVFPVVRDFFDSTGKERQAWLRALANMEDAQLSTVASTANAHGTAGAKELQEAALSILRERGRDMDGDGEDIEAEFEEPDEGDWTTEDHRKFYSYGKLVLYLPADTGECEMWAAIEARMKKDGFWPNVWLISDHGNSHLMTNPGSKVCRPPRKKKGKKKRGAKVHRA